MAVADHRDWAVAHHNKLLELKDNPQLVVDRYQRVGNLASVSSLGYYTLRVGSLGAAHQNKPVGVVHRNSHWAVGKRLESEQVLGVPPWWRSSCGNALRRLF